MGNDCPGILNVHHISGRLNVVADNLSMISYTHTCNISKEDNSIDRFPDLNTIEMYGYLLNSTAKGDRGLIGLFRQRKIT